MFSTHCIECLQNEFGGYWRDQGLSSSYIFPELKTPRRNMQLEMELILCFDGNKWRDLKHAEERLEKRIQRIVDFTNAAWSNSQARWTRKWGSPLRILSTRVWHLALARCSFWQEEHWLMTPPPPFLRRLSVEPKETETWDTIHLNRPYHQMARWWLEYLVIQIFVSIWKTVTKTRAQRWEV